MTAFAITLEAGASICDQAVYAVKKALISGHLRAGEPFPSVRTLSADLKINPNTAHKLIARLTSEGLLEVKPGIGTKVAATVAENSSGRNNLLKRDLERIVVEAKHLGIELGDLTAALSYHWSRLSPNTST